MYYLKNPLPSLILSKSLTKFAFTFEKSILNLNVKNLDCYFDTEIDKKERKLEKFFLEVKKITSIHKNIFFGCFHS